jgi:hypothetical protein
MKLYVQVLSKSNAINVVKTFYKILTVWKHSNARSSDPYYNGSENIFLGGQQPRVPLLLHFF